MKALTIISLVCATAMILIAMSYGRNDDMSTCMKTHSYDTCAYALK